MNTSSKCQHNKLLKHAYLILVLNFVSIGIFYSAFTAHYNLFDAGTQRVIKEFAEQAATQHMAKGQVELIQHALGNITNETGSFMASIATNVISTLALMSMMTIFLLIGVIHKLSKSSPDTQDCSK